MTLKDTHQKREKTQKRWVTQAGIRDSALVHLLPTERHAYVWPFVPLYALWLYAWLFPGAFVILEGGGEEEDGGAGASLLPSLSLLLLVSLHALTLLSCQWSVSVKALLTCSPVSLYFPISIKHFLWSYENERNSFRNSKNDLGPTRP
jgi:hypothetical protein